MVNIAVHEKYIQTLQVFGDPQQTVEKAIQRYAVEQITDKIAELQQRSRVYQERYGLDYAQFERRVAEDRAFVEQIEQQVSPTWELDFADWEFCERGIDDWTRTLTTILRE
jgi:hypothetical protein